MIWNLSNLSSDVNIINLLSLLDKTPKDLDQIVQNLMLKNLCDYNEQF